MKCCGICANSKTSLFNGRVCGLSGKTVGYLMVCDSFKEKTDMEDAKENVCIEQNDVPMKVCKRCGRKLPTTHYSKCKRNNDGLQGYCKDCQKEMVATARKRKREVAEKEAERASGELKVAKDDRAKTWVSRHETRMTLADIPDSSLIAELKKRGYMGKIYRKVEIEF